MILTFVELEGIIHNSKKGSKNHLIGDCPFCGKEKHFYIKIGYGKHGEPNPFDCKKCGERGSLITLLRHLNLLHLLHGKQVDLNKKLESIGNLSVKEYNFEAPPNIKFLAGHKFITASDNNKFSSYLRRRGFTDYDFELYTPFYTNLKRKFEDYVMLSIYNDFELKGYVGRNLRDDDRLRYQNNKHAKFSKLLMGLDEIENKTHTVIIQEGPFDKINTTTTMSYHLNPEIKVVCSFGKKLSEDQLYLLTSKPNISNIIIMYDYRDAVDDMKKVAMPIIDIYGEKHVFCAYTENGDAGESDYEDFVAAYNNLQPAVNFFYSKVPKISKKIW